MRTRGRVVVLTLVAWGVVVASGDLAQAQVRFRSRSANTALQPFRGFGQPANLGFLQRRGNASLRFNFSAAQGSRLSQGTIAPSLTLPQGGFGSIQSGSWRPFVTGVTPIVGQPTFWPQPQPPRTWPNRGVQAVEDSRESERQRVRNERRLRIIDRLTRKAEHERNMGRLGSARMYYRMALKRVTDGDAADLREALSARLTELQ